MVSPCFIPINDLTEHTSKSCTIIAKITKVNPVASYDGKKGSGRRQSLTLKDTSGAISMTLFNDPIDKFAAFLQEGQIIEIKNFNCQLSYYNKNKLELTSRDGGALATEIKLSTHIDLSSSIAKTDKFEPIPLNMLPNVAVDAVIDILGVVTSVEEPREVPTKAGRMVLKCTIKLKDASNVQVGVTFWGMAAKTHGLTKNSAVEIHGGKVSSFDIRSISMDGTSTFKVSPKTPEAEALLEWWQMDQNSDSKPFLFQQGPTSDVVYRSISYGLQAHPAALYCSFTTRVTLERYLGVLNESWHNFYESCVQNGCTRKVLPNGEKLLCTKCRTNSTDFKYRIRIPVEVTDGQTKMSTTIFGEVIEKLTGISTTSLHLIAQSEPNLFRVILDPKLGNSFVGEFRHQRACVSTKPKTAETPTAGPSTSKSNGSPTTLKTLKITVSNLTPIQAKTILKMQS